MRPIRIFVIVFAAGLFGFAVGAEQDRIAITDIESAQRLIGIVFTPVERDSMREDLEENLDSYDAIRQVTLANHVVPSIRFDPTPHANPGLGSTSGGVRTTPVTVKRPERLEDLAFYTVVELSELVRTKQVSSMELTEMYLDRLRRLGPDLECVITLTEERARTNARRADEEIASGKYRGPLHGIPYGAKDLLAVAGYPTTWGAEPYREQVIDKDATVIQRLDEAGAVLIAKLTLGALAWGDVWYGGTTRNPWNLEEGSSGSSAGSASATAAGLVAFAIGTETWGSIVSPATRCGATGLRPTFGRVSRAGAMALSWTMDKIGPICRSVEDCAVVFDAIAGPDGIDATVEAAPFSYSPIDDPKKVRVGYVRALFEEDYPERASDSTTLDVLRGLGFELEPIDLPDYPVYPLSIILVAEAAAAFDELTRSNSDSLLVRQIRAAWPNVFRESRFIPAVEYIQANRIRTLLMEEMQRLEVDVYVAPSFGGDNLLLTNLTGHPCVVLPNGFSEDGTPVSISFMGQLNGEGVLLGVANSYQNATVFHKRHPQHFE